MSGAKLPAKPSPLALTHAKAMENPKSVWAKHAKSMDLFHKNHPKPDAFPTKCESEKNWASIEQTIKNEKEAAEQKAAVADAPPAEKAMEPPAENALESK